jgi:hypothetical protein
METKALMPDQSRFRWTRGGWFGCQLGFTALPLVGAVVLAPRAPEVAGVWLACLAVANAIGSVMWRRRDRLRPYPAQQALLTVCGVSGLTALLALHVCRPGLRITRPLGIYLADEPRLIFWLLVLVVSLMTWLHLIERAARKHESRSQGQTSS